MTSQSSSSSNSSGSLEQHQPSFDQQRASGSSHGSSADQPGPSGLQGGPSTSQVKNHDHTNYTWLDNIVYVQLVVKSYSNQSSQLNLHLLI